MDCVFLALKCGKKDADCVMKALRCVDLAGYVFTMPMKEAVGEYLDEWKDEALLTGAVNCVLNKDGYLTGYNTDSMGFWTAVREKCDPKRTIRKVFVMGMGGFAKAAAAQAALQGVSEIVVANRLWETVFVKGLIRLKEAEVPEHLAKAKPILKKLDRLCKDTGFSRIDLAMGYIKREKQVNHLVFGIRTLEQLKEDIASFQKDIPESVFEAIDKEFSEIEADLVVPSLWKK